MAERGGDIDDVGVQEKFSKVGPHRFNGGFGWGPYIDEENALLTHEDFQRPDALNDLSFTFNVQSQ